jgi:hypothetical protein
MSTLDSNTLTIIVTIAALAAGIGPLLIVLGMMASGIGSIITIIPALMAGLTLLAAHPIILVLVLIIAAAVLLEMKFGLLSKTAAVLSDGFTWLVTGISEFVDWIVNATKGIDLVGIAFKILLGPIGWIMLAMDALGISWDDVFGAMISAAQTAAGLISGAIGMIIGGIKSQINTVIGMINIMVDALNSLNFTVPDWVPGIGGMNIGLPRISRLPQLAEGGTLTGSGSVLVGERGPEILSLPSGATVTPMDKAGVTITGNTFVVREEADIQKVAKELYTLIDRTNRGRGAGI